MNSEQILISVFLVGVILLLNCYIGKQDDTHEYFSLSTKPFDVDWGMLNRNPFDDIDYITPNMQMINTNAYAR